MPDAVNDLDLPNMIRGEEHEEDPAQRDAPAFDLEPVEGEVEDADAEEGDDVE